MERSWKSRFQDRLVVVDSRMGLARSSSSLILLNRRARLFGLSLAENLLIVRLSRRTSQRYFYRSRLVIIANVSRKTSKFPLGKHTHLGSKSDTAFDCIVLM